MPKSPPGGLEVRRARSSDIPSLANLLALTPDDGTLYQFPRVLDHPDEMTKLHISWLRSAIHDATTLIRVAVVPGDTKQIVVGFSSWTKKTIENKSEGFTKPTQLADMSWLDSLNTFLLGLESRYSNIVSRPSTPQSLIPDERHQAAIRRVRKRSPLSPTKTIPCYELGGLAIRQEYQGLGIATILVRWGISKAAEEDLPVFTTGETRGIDFYQKALGFQRLRDSEYWLDKDGNDVTRDEADSGSSAWQKSSGGVSGAEMIWCPPGYATEIAGHVYKG